MTLHIGGAKADKVVYNLFKNPGILEEPPVEITVDDNNYLISFVELFIISINIC